MNHGRDKQTDRVIFIKYGIKKASYDKANLGRLHLVRWKCKGNFLVNKYAIEQEVYYHNCVIRTWHIPESKCLSGRYYRTMSYFLTKDAKQNYRGVFETQESGNKTSSGEIGLNIRTLANPKGGQDQVSGGVNFLCLHASPVANVEMNL